jgi:hypothetical protein
LWQKHYDTRRVFQKIKGSTKYWQQAKFELLAKQEQLGCFQFFVTLSCADKLWPETFATICSRLGHSVEIGKVQVDYEESTVTTGPVTVNSMPMEQFLETENLHELIKDDVLTVTRIFDNRLKMMFKHIVMGSSNPMQVQEYNYRIEFQQRGMPHAHGVLWAHLTEQLREAMEHIYSCDFTDGDEHYQMVVDYIDAHITCTTDTDEELALLVLNVQCHHHTRTCHKTGKVCRFRYPRPPSEYTILARPLPKDMDEKEVKRLTKKYCDILECVMNTLRQDDLVDDLSLKAFAT